MAGTTKVYSGYSDVKSIATPPSAPVIKAVSKSIDTITLTWTKVVNATGYVVYVNGVENSVINDGNTISVDISGLNLGESYDFSLVTKNGELSSAPSAIVKATPIPGSVSNLKVSDVNFNRLSLSWDSVEGADHYDVYQGTSSTAVNTKVGSVSETSFSTTTPLNFNTVYYYKVIPVTANGISGVVSPVINGKTAIKNPVDFNVVSPNATSADLSWSAVEGATGYEISYSKGSSTTYTILRSVTTLNTNHTGLSVNTVFNYRVRAYRMAGTTKVYSGYSDVKSITTPLSSTTLKYSPIDSQSFKLSWNSVIGTNEYIIYRRNLSNDNNDYEEYTKTSKFEIIVQVDSLNPNYSYFVQASNSNNSSLQSNIVIGGPVPASVSNIVFESESNVIHLTWNHSQYASSYDVYMGTSSLTLGQKIGTTTSNSFSTQNNLLFNTTYYFSVVPISEFGYTLGFNSSTPKFSAVTKLDKVKNFSYQVETESFALLSWDPVSGATGYEIYQSKNDENEYTFLRSVASIYLPLSNLEIGNEYNFKIRSYKYIGTTKIYSEFSDSISFKTKLVTPYVYIDYNSDAAFVISWEPVKSALGFEIYRDGILYRIVDNSNPEGIIVDDIVPGQEYSFNVLAFNGDDRSELSITCTLPAIPKAVTNLTITNVNYNSASLSWNSVEGASSYDIYMKEYGYDKKITSTNGETNITLNNLVTNKVYEFLVIAVTNNGISGIKSSVVSTTPKLDLVKNIRFTPNGLNKVKVDWDPVEGASYYDVKFYENGNYSSGISNLNTTTYNASVKDGKSYVISIKPIRYVSATTYQGEIVSSVIYNYTKVTKIEMDSYNLSLNIGDVHNLNASIVPQNASDQRITYLTSDPSVATVDSNGNVTAIGMGNAYITAKNLEGIIATCYVSVNLEISGSGSMNLSNFNLVDGQYKVTATHTGSGSFIVNAYKGSSIEGNLLFDETGNYSGTNVLFNGYKKVYANTNFVINTEGEWTIKIEKIFNDRSTSNMSGTGDKVTDLFTTNIVNMTDINITYDGSDMITIWAYNYATSIFVYSGVGPVNRKVSVYFGAPDTFISVQSTGNWTIDFMRGDQLTEYK